MSSTFNALYQEMLKEVALCGEKFTDKAQEIECCFAVTNTYWLKAKAMFSSPSPSRDEEVLFLKNIKPLFKSQIEYYNLLYHSLLFHPLDPVALQHFWKRESLRLQRFILDNPLFYAYYKSGGTAMDDQYFSSIEELKDGDEWTSEYDPLVSLLLALEKYDVYAQLKMKELQTI